jgi:hypothetical protein
LFSRKSKGTFLAALATTATAITTTVATEPSRATVPTTA